MGAGNFGSPVQLLILLAIILLLFGGKRLRNLGGDLGGAIKGFKNAMAPADQDTQPKNINREAPELIAVTTELQKNQRNVNN